MRFKIFESVVRILAKLEVQKFKMLRLFLYNYIRGYKLYIKTKTFNTNLDLSESLALSLKTNARGCEVEGEDSEDNADLLSLCIEHKSI